MEMTKKEEKKIGTLLGVGNAFIPVHTFNGEDYVALFAFKEAIKGLEEENKKLNIKVASLEGEIKGLNYTIGKLKEENLTLELWLDNKEKLNEEYRKQIDKLKK